MRRWGLAVWLFRVALPAMVAYWSGRSTYALRRWIAGADEPPAGDLRPALLRILNQTQMVSMLLVLMIVVEMYRILLSIR